MPVISELERQIPGARQTDRLTCSVSSIPVRGLDSTQKGRLYVRGRSREVIPLTSMFTHKQQTNFFLKKWIYGLAKMT